MTSDHLRPLLNHVRVSHLLFLLGDQLAKAQTPASVNDAIQLGRLTALQKPSGGVRGDVAHDAEVGGTHHVSPARLTSSARPWSPPQPLPSAP